MGNIKIIVINRVTLTLVAWIVENNIIQKWRKISTYSARLFSIIDYFQDWFWLFPYFWQNYFQCHFRYKIIHAELNYTCHYVNGYNYMPISEGSVCNIGFCSLISLMSVCSLKVKWSNMWPQWKVETKTNTLVLRSIKFLFHIFI